ncbi:MAG: hypothetical protein J7623_27740 [Chitinophaga sp.]|uniref:hypothetical protein n=1 Tax=Chitinophaga sp. TaxID=1869181 RepID=UPI001B006BEF|nr:hypothetical protein [Chitinophaga sp.]MBO9732466.1 hypothetical protein [Chitinophaga sp.]
MFQKYVGILCILVALPIFFFDTHNNMLLLLGLFILFTAPGKYEDERSVSLKTSSLYFSFILSYVFKLLTAHLSLPFNLTDVNHFMILVFSLSLLLYYIRFYSFK